MASTLPSALPSATPTFAMCLFTSTTARQRYARLRHYLHKHTQLWDGVVATLLICMAQLLIAGIDLMLDNHSVDFPPSILAMVAVFAVLSACGCVMPRLEEFYQKHLSRAVSVLPRTELAERFGLPHTDTGRPTFSTDTCPSALPSLLS